MTTAEPVGSVVPPTAEIPDEADSQLHQKYDAVLRRWAQHNLPTVAGWLDPTVAGLAPAAYTEQPATFALPTVTADLLIGAGRNRLMHVEYESCPRRTLVTRMFNYRARIMTLYPRARLTQFVIVLGDGRVRGHDDVSNGFILDLRVIYLREHDPAEFLHDPVLAPLAVLARGRRKARERSFSAALRLIRDSGHPWTGELLQTAETLALIRLDETTIARIRKENAMSIQPLVDHYRNTEVGLHLQRLGREEGREAMLSALLHSRFGPDVDATAIARQLADRSEQQAIDAVLAAPDARSLLTPDPR
jgi:hypothetical protein